MFWMTKPATTLPLIAATLLGLWSLPGLAQAPQPVPMPGVAYEAQANMLGGRGTASFRHQDGRVRMDMNMTGLPAAITGVLDISQRKMVMMLPMPGTRSAVEIDMTEELGFGASHGSGIRGGQDTVIGETCDLWTIAAPKAEGPVTACITSDGITLRTQATVRGKVETVMEVTALKRGPQDEAQFQLPADLRIMKMPGGLKGLIPQGGARPPS
jgi:hypothetical protein